MAAIEDKRRSGKFASRYDKNALYPLVAAVCRHVNPDDPVSVSQPEWDRARAAAGHPHAPSARAIYGRLKRPWDEIKRIALDPARSVVQTESTTARVAERKLSPAELHFALHRVAHELGVRSFSVFDYARTRDKLIASDKRKRGNNGVVDQVMPTADQISTQSGGWDKALVSVGLEPYVQQASRTALSLEDAFNLLVDLTDSIPNRSAIESLRTRHGVSVEKPAAGQSWQDMAGTFAAARAARGDRVPEVEITPAQRDGLVIPDAVLLSLPRKREKGYWTYGRCLAALAEFVAQPGVDPTWRTYKKLCAGNPDWPAVSSLNRHGTFDEMVDAARHLLLTGEVMPLDQAKS